MFHLPLNPNMSFCEEKKPCYGASRETLLSHLLVTAERSGEPEGARREDSTTMSVGGQASVLPQDGRIF